MAKCSGKSTSEQDKNRLLHCTAPALLLLPLPPCRSIDGRPGNKPTPRQRQRQALLYLASPTVTNMFHLVQGAAGCSARRQYNNRGSAGTVVAWPRVRVCPKVRSRWDRAPVVVGGERERATQRTVALDASSPPGLTAQAHKSTEQVVGLGAGAGLRGVLRLCYCQRGQMPRGESRRAAGACLSLAAKMEDSV